MQHRKNRGMGGSKLLDMPSNLVTMCLVHNTLIEQSAEFARFAFEHGWTLKCPKGVLWPFPVVASSPDLPRVAPVSFRDGRFLLDDEFRRVPVGGGYAN